MNIKNTTSSLFLRCLGLLLALVAPIEFRAQDAPPDAEAKLTAFFRHYLDESFALRPMDATRLGDHRFDNLLDDLSADARARWFVQTRQTLEALPKEVDYAKLTRAGQIDFEILQHELTASLWLAENTHPFEEDPRVYNEYINESVYALLTQSTLPKETNVANCIARMARIPSVVANARQNLKHPPRTHTETAIRQNRGAIAFYEHDLFDLAGESPQLPALRQAAQTVAESLKDYQQFLEKDLLPRADGQWRIGKEKFDRKLELTLDANLTADQVLADAESEFDRVERDMYVIARQLWSKYYPQRALPPDDVEGRRQTVQRVLDGVAQDHGQPENLTRDVTQTVAEIKRFIAERDILRLPEPDRCQIIEMPEFQRGNSTAYMNSPPPLDPKASGYYAVSPPPKDWDAQRVKSYLEEYNSHMLQILTLHEAYPGHYVQLEYANRNPSLIRKVLGSGVYIEGWAVYTEQMMLDQGYGGGDLALRLTQLKFYLRAVANAILDNKMQCTSLSDADALEFLTKRAFQSEGEARLKVIRSQQSSCQLSTYFVGRMAHYRLRQQLERELGERFNLGRFHEAVLAPGPVPVKYLRELVGTSLRQTASVSPRGSKADYERAGNLRHLTENTVFKNQLKAHWLPDNKRFWYRNDLPGGAREFILVDAERGSKERAFDHERLAKAFATELGKPVHADQLPVERIAFTESDQGLRLWGRAGSWTCELESYELHHATDEEPPEKSLAPLAESHPSRRTGQETTVTFVNRAASDVNLWWIDADGDRQSYGSIAPGAQKEQHTFAGHVWAVTEGSGKTLAIFEAMEEPRAAVIGRDSAKAPRVPVKRDAADSSPGDSPDGKWLAFFKNGNLQARDLETGDEFTLSTDGSAEDEYAGRVWWSLDSRKVVALRTKKGDDRSVSYVESSPKDQLQPKLHSYHYLKPGDRIPLSKPQLFDIEKREHIEVSDSLFPNPWSITDMHWAADSSTFSFLYNQRGHQLLRYIEVDAASGKARTLIEETSPTFIDYAGKLFLEVMDASHEIVWMSERDGWNHLYLYDTRTGTLKNQITRGQWVVRGVERVDREHRQIWFKAGGVIPGQDPYYVHYCRINFDGSDFVVLTGGDGTHAIDFSPDRRFFVDTWSRVDLPPVHELRRAQDGVKVCDLEKADWAELLRIGWQPPERFVAKGRDGQTDIFGIILRPSHFDPSRRYPVIEDIYAGPHGAFVPKGFRSYYAMQELAELGFILVKIDGMGTSYRSKRFHDVCWKNLGDAGFPDRILWIKAAAARYPYLDLSRIGIYGGSAGGQSSTRALLAYGDFYKAAVSDCGCHDNRMDKIWWNELWMGWPVGPEYAEQSNVTQAHRLTGSLMLTVGEMDENVDPSSTMQVANALIKADKDFDLLIIPGKGHGAGESDYGRRRRADFFVRHLLGVEPRHTADASQGMLAAASANL